MTKQNSENTPLSTPSESPGSKSFNPADPMGVYPNFSYDEDGNPTGFPKDSVDLLDEGIHPMAFRANPELADSKIRQAQGMLKQAVGDLDLNKEKSFYNGNSSMGMGLLNQIANRIKKNPKTSGSVGVLVSVLVTLGLGVATMLGPLQLLNFSNMLTDINFGPGDSQTDIRLRKLFAYSMFAKNVKGFEKTRLGTIEAFQANRIDAKMAQSGIISTFDPNGKFTGFDLDTSKLPSDVQKSISGLNDENDPDGSKRKKALSQHFKGEVTFKDGKPHITPRGMLQTRKLFTQALQISPDFHGNASALSKRVLIKRANVTLNPITRLKNKTLEKFADKYIDFQNQRQERIAGNDIDIPDAKPREAEAENPDNPTEDSDIDEFNEDQKKAADLVNKLKIPGSVLGGAAASGVGAIVGAICMIRDISDGVADLQMTQRLTTATNIASEAISWPSKMFTGDFDVEAMFLYISSMYSKENGSAQSASIIQKEVKGKTSNLVTMTKTLDKSENQIFNPNLDSNWAKIDETFKSLGPANEGIGVVCKLMDLPGEFISKITSFITFGASDKLSEATVGKLFGNLMGVLAGSAPEVAKITGSAMGELAAIGARLLAGLAASATGAQVASDKTSANAKAFYKDYQYINDDRSTLAKIANIADPNSVAGQYLIKSSGKSLVDNVASMPTNILFSFSGMFGSAKAEDQYATTTEDYYGVPQVIMDPIYTSPPEGTNFVTNTGESVEFDNPYILLEQAQARLPLVKDYLEECNKITISDDLYATTDSSDEVDYNYIKKDGGCEDPEKGGKYTMNNLPQYQTIAKKPSLTRAIAGIFSPSAIAAEPVQAQTITMTPEQAALAQVTMALSYTKEGMAYAALEENDDESMQAMYDGAMPSGSSDSSGGGSGTAKRINASKEELAKKILAHPKIKFGNYGDGASQKADVQLFLTLNARTALLMMAEQSGVDIPINSLFRPLESGSDHAVGKAIDIGYYGNGQPQHTADGDKLYNYLYDNYKELRISQLIWQEPPNGKKCIGNYGQKIEDVKPVDCYEYYKKGTMDGHYHHIHIGFLPDGQ